jgi:hypothetical protein
MDLGLLVLSKGKTNKSQTTIHSTYHAPIDGLEPVLIE